MRNINSGSASTPAGNNSTTTIINEREITDTKCQPSLSSSIKNHTQHKGRLSPLNIGSCLNYIFQQQYYLSDFIQDSENINLKLTFLYTFKRVLPITFNYSI
ncbi:hypothetical protein ACTFIV_004122 [Dictyostelium citrinum]